MSEDFMQPDMGLTNIPDVIRANMLKGDSGFPYAGMWIFSGQQGSGKTLLMMHLVKQIHEQYPDAWIVSNISIYGIPISGCIKSSDTCTPPHKVKGEGPNPSPALTACPSSEHPSACA